MTESTIRLLVITYHYPPMGGVGVQRVLGLLKRFPDNSVQPIVVTNGHGISETMDPELEQLREVRTTPVYRCGGASLGQYLGRRVARTGRALPDYLFAARHIPFLDVYASWSRGVARQVEAIATKEQVDMVYTTSPPHSVHFLGRHLRRELNLPWVMEFRDSMVNWPMRASGTESMLVRQAERFHEKRLVAACDGVIFVTRSQKRNAERRGALRDDKPSTVVTNGYDPDNYALTHTRPERGGRFVITYTGSLTDHDISGFAEALLEEAKSSGSERPGVLLRVVGRVGENNLRKLKKIEGPIDVQITGFVPHSMVAGYQQTSDALLLLQTTNYQGAGGEMINAKLFEYIGAGRPIIAITPYGEQRSIVEDYRLGYTASPDNILEIRNAIRSCRGSLPDWETSAMERHTDDFDRRALTSKFVAFLRKVRSRTSLVSD